MCVHNDALRINVEINNADYCIYLAASDNIIEALLSLVSKWCDNIEPCNHGNWEINSLFIRMTNALYIGLL